MRIRWRITTKWNLNIIINLTIKYLTCGLKFSRNTGRGRRGQRRTTDKLIRDDIIGYPDTATDSSQPKNNPALFSKPWDRKFRKFAGRCILKSPRSDKFTEDDSQIGAILVMCMCHSLSYLYFQAWSLFLKSISTGWIRTRRVIEDINCKSETQLNSQNKKNGSLG